MALNIIPFKNYQKTKNLDFCWETLSVVSVACDDYDMSHIAQKWLIFPEIENGYIDPLFFKKSLTLMVYLSIKGAHSRSQFIEDLSTAIYNMLVELRKYSKEGIEVDDIGCNLNVDLGNEKFDWIFDNLSSALEVCKDDKIYRIVNRYWRVINNNDPLTFDMRKFALLIKTIDCIENSYSDLFVCQCVKKSLQRIESMGVDHFELEIPTSLDKRVLELL